MGKILTGMNRLESVFDGAQEKLLNIYFTAGYPALEDTRRILKVLDNHGADLVEIGLPFSDPIADGPTIQESSFKALENGMSLGLLLDQLEGMRSEINAPVLLMGYLNPILQFGFEKFCERCSEIGVDGLILPDLPMYEYKTMYKDILAKNGLFNIFLITPQTSESRIKEIDEESRGFIYMVADSSITGAKNTISQKQIDYFDRVNALNLKNKLLIGFGISSHETFKTASSYADGAIIGSAFINQLKKDASDSAIKDFITMIKKGN